MPSSGLRAGVGRGALWYWDDIFSAGWIYVGSAESFVLLLFSYNRFWPDLGTLLLVVAKQRL